MEWFGHSSVLHYSHLYSFSVKLEKFNKNVSVDQFLTQWSQFPQKIEQTTTERECSRNSTDTKWVFWLLTKHATTRRPKHSRSFLHFRCWKQFSSAKWLALIFSTIVSPTKWQSSRRRQYSPKMKQFSLSHENYSTRKQKLISAEFRLKFERFGQRKKQCLVFLVFLALRCKHSFCYIGISLDAETNERKSPNMTQWMR